MLGLGAVLSVERKGEELPVTYFSKRLTAAEKNYSASELECLAVIKAVDTMPPTGAGIHGHHRPPGVNGSQRLLQT